MTHTGGPGNLVTFMYECDRSSY